MGKIDDRIKKKGLDVFKKNGDSRLLTELNSCVHCGLCAESCIFYQVFQDARYIPAKKVDLVASIYRRYHTLTGKTLPWLTGARSLDEDTASEMVDLLFGACTMCGRCNVHCSIGVDISYVVQKGREMLAEIDYVPDSLQTTVDSAIRTGNNMAIPTADFIDTLKWLEEDLKMEVGDESARIPLDEPGKDILYTLNPREPKFFPLSISAMAKIFHAASESWTISTRMYDVTNYGFFNGNKHESKLIAERLYDEMQRLGAKRLVLAECGHGSRAFRWEAPNYLAKEFPFEVLTSVELLAEYIRDGKIRLDPEKIKNKVTLHDPCNLVRMGGIVAEQRYILGKAVKDFVEMTPNGANNLCCGGGGGQLAMSEYNDRRIKVASRKAEQIRSTGAKIVCTPCHNCIDQLTQTNVTYKLGVKVMSLAEIVADALVEIPGKSQTPNPIENPPIS
jgi:Fe-S oxidoreductase